MVVVFVSVLMVLVVLNDVVQLSKKRGLRLNKSLNVVQYPKKNQIVRIKKLCSTLAFQICLNLLFDLILHDI